MTFDEAIEQLNPRTIWSPEMRDLLEQLRATYAPTIEMTEMQMKQMMSFKEGNAGFSTFMYKQGLGHVPAFSEFITTKREDELMTAWLHPETLKVVD